MALEERAHGHKPINNLEGRNALIALVSGTLQDMHPLRDVPSAYAPTCEQLLNTLSDERFGARASYPELADYQYLALSQLTHQITPILEADLIKRRLNTPGYQWTLITETYRDSDTNDDGVFEYTMNNPDAVMKTILLYTSTHHPAEDGDRTASLVLADVQWSNMFEVWSDVLAKIARQDANDNAILLARELIQLTDTIIADVDDYRSRIDMVSRYP